MAKRHEVFSSRYLQAADLGGKPINVVIEKAPLETLKSKNGEEVKTVLHFRGAKKSLPLNRTNWDSVADITGEDDSENWPGQQIQLYPTTTPFGADVVECIRIRAPEQGELKPAKIKAATAKTAEPKPSLADEMDDSIPF
jgi:hypothetical protein